jgi:hypothetical protein
MIVFRSVVLLVIALGAALTGVWLLDCNQGRGCESTWRAVGELARLDREREDMERVALLLNRRSDELSAITTDVIAGRVGLLEAAAAFRAADAIVPSGARVQLAPYFAGGSDAERECRRVISFVDTALDGEPSRRAAVVAGLEAELQEHLRQEGGVRLPAAAAVN